MKRAEALRSIPSMERLLSHARADQLSETYGRDTLKAALRHVLSTVRGSEGGIPGQAELLRMGEELLATQFAPSLRRVINATGILIHTNLGRSPVDRGLLQSAGELLIGYSNLEFDLDQGERGHRSGHLKTLCHELFDSESAILANNNAGGTLLVLAALSAGKEVLVSRGELVEIGGAFRVPDVIQQGGAILREVGTTNRTRVADYENAISERTGAILRVHRSNFDIVGFTEQPSLEELVAVVRKHDIPLIYDEGSGRIVDLTPYGLRKGETLRELVGMGVDVVTCSTDKLIGSLQGGLILGREALVARCAKHPLMRALRAGKESYAVVAETLRCFISGRYEEQVSIYQMAARSCDELRVRANVIVGRTGGAVVETEAAFGGGTTPTETMPSIGIAYDRPVDRHAALLRRATPIVARIENDRLIFDLRTIDPSDDEQLIAALNP